MNILRLFAGFALVCAAASTLGCAKESFRQDDFSAYFGGEVTNPVGDYVLLFKGEELIDSIRIGANNRFFASFDSLAPGLYTFRHHPEYQYVFFDKNDSLMVTINPSDFDESIVFSGRGDQKNNFLMELYLRNEKDRDHLFTLYDNDLPRFTRAIDSMYRRNLKFYQSQKAEIQWSAGFEEYAKASLDFAYYSKKELYPMVHYLRTGNSVAEKLPNDYYAYRKKIDFNNDRLVHFSPFVRYLSFMLNNLAAIQYHNHLSQQDLALKTGVNKLQIADTLLQNNKIRSVILNNIAFSYLLEDQNMANNAKFLESYHKLNLDPKHREEILRIGQSIKQLSPGSSLPNIRLIDHDGNIASSDELLTGKTVIFFWSDKAMSHMEEAHKKVLQLKKRYPGYAFVAINVDPDQEIWSATLADFKVDGIRQYRAENFEVLKNKWAIIKLHRTLILDQKGLVKNAFTDLFDSKFEEQIGTANP
jgi:hypothetical protein